MAARRVDRRAAGEAGARSGDREINNPSLTVFSSLNVGRWTLSVLLVSISKNRLTLLWLCSAAVVVLARAFNTTDLGYDLPSQIQAAQHLLSGKGLSIYSWAGEDDLATPAKLLILTHFPAGYSVCVAVLIALGVSVPIAVKIYGAAATVLGWWGWGELAYSFLREGLMRGRVWRWAGYAIAVFSPLLFTPSWQGTEIFLWAAIPWVLRFVVRASEEETRRGLRFDWLTGLVSGSCALMRYAGVFLVIYAGFLIFCQSKARLKMVPARLGAFAAGAVPFLALQIYVNYFVSKTGATSDNAAFREGVSAVVGRLWDGLWLLTSANFAVAWWMPHQLVELLPSQAGRRLGCSAQPLCCSRCCRSSLP